MEIALSCAYDMIKFHLKDNSNNGMEIEYYAEKTCRYAAVTFRSSPGLPPLKNDYFLGYAQDYRGKEKPFWKITFFPRSTRGNRYFRVHQIYARRVACLCVRVSLVKIGYHKSSSSGKEFKCGDPFHISHVIRPALFERRRNLSRFHVSPRYPWLFTLATPGNSNNRTRRAGTPPVGHGDVTFIDS